MPENNDPETFQRRLVKITLDESSLSRNGPDAEKDRAVAIHDLLDQNVFGLVGHSSGPYSLHLSVVEHRLHFDVRHADDTPIANVPLSLIPFSRIVKDYVFSLEGYYRAMRNGGNPNDTIVQNRRNLHNEGAALVVSRLGRRIDVDFETARILFTLISSLIRHSEELDPPVISPRAKAVSPSPPVPNQKPATISPSWQGGRLVLGEHSAQIDLDAAVFLEALIGLRSTFSGFVTEIHSAAQGGVNIDKRFVSWLRFSCSSFRQIRFPK